MSIVHDDQHWNLRAELAELVARNNYLARECFRLLDERAEGERRVESARFWATRLENRCAYLEGVLVEMRERMDGSPLD